MPKRRDYSRLGIDELTRLARFGEATAQRTLGQRLCEGSGCKPNLKAGVEWLEKAARQNDAEAQYLLGDYEWGMDNLPEAENWWLKAADQKHPEALYCLGELNATGRPPDYAVAALWYADAVELGHEDAMNALGEIYLEGKGTVRKSTAKAKRLFERAGKLGCYFALVNLTQMYRDGIGVAKDPKRATEYNRLAATAEARDVDLSGNQGMAGKSNGSGSN